MVLMADNVLTTGNKIARLGEFFGLTQQAWADYLKVHRGTISAYKSRNNANPTTEKIREISNALGIPITWFYNGDDSDPEISRNLEEAISVAADGKVVAVSPDLLTREQRTLVIHSDVVLPVWRGVVAGLNDECQFSDDSYEPGQEVPAFFLSNKNPNDFILCLPKGVSMAPRIVQGDQVIVKQESTPPPNSIVVARRADGVNYIKVFRVVKGVPELHSINGDFPPISPIGEWVCRAVAVGIHKPYPQDGPNIEFNGGAPLRA
jgi:transcriptional regulator with XRE-family HTH domain